MDVTGAPPASRREAGKAERRRRIVEAAATLLREAGTDDVSMIQIAQRAGVAPTTLYNLFATKGAIFRAVFDQDLAEFTEAVSRVRAAEPTDRIFAAIDLAAALYERDPQFYRAMTQVGDHGPEHLRAAISAPRVAFWQALAQEAARDGGMSPTARPGLLGSAIAQLMRGVFLDWASGAITPKRLSEEAAYGCALLLMARASPVTRRRLSDRLHELEAVLES